MQIHKSTKLLIAFSLAVLTASSQFSRTVSGYSISFNEDWLNTYKTITKTDTTINSIHIRTETAKDSLSLNWAKYRFEMKEDSVISKSIEVYDYASNLIYDAVHYHGMPLSVYSYQYDDRGLLIKRTGFGSGNLGTTTYYTYPNSSIKQKPKSYFLRTK